MSDTDVEVYLDRPDGPVLVGRLFLHRGGAGESSTFNYDPGWLATRGAYAIDPELPLVSGAFHTRVGQALFGALSDSAPDRWGVELARRGERRRADQAGATPRRLGEADFFLAVRDLLRQGALRLRDPIEGSFIAPDGEGIPHLLDLPRLLGASARLERDAESDEDLSLLLEAGSSLGGARPKAHVDDSGRLLIAKFPRLERDDWSVVVWEQIALEMAAAGGIRVSRSRLAPVAGRSVLLVERFDRTADGGRLGFVSAMTMLEASDNERRTYVEIAEVIETESTRTTDDLQELWRRVAFSILISNTDDHLRNHGFLRRGPGWTLSPAFDVNPAPDSIGLLSTAIEDPRDRLAAIETLVEVAELFRVADVRLELRRLIDATATWRERAHHYGVQAEIPRLAPAFEHAQRDDARRIAGV